MRHHLHTPKLHAKALLLSLLLPAALGLHAQNVDLNALDAYLANAVQQFEQPGLAVGIVKDGQLVWSKGYGKLDLAKPEPVTPNSVFYCASISKAFTACAIGLLVDDGKLSFDDPVRKHLPWFNTPDAYVTEHMLVKDLLCHRSGWITFDGDLLWYGTHMDQKEILKRHANEPFTYPFRDEFGYSNLMFVAAAQVIEAVSGMTWEQFITTRIFQPLGMDRSRVDVAGLQGMSDVALPHVRKGQDPAAPQKSMPYQDLHGADGACGVMSTVNDLAKWDAMWANEGKVGDKPFLSKASFNTITATHLAMGGRREGAGLGWFIESNNNAKVITHSGGMPGFILNHAVVPEKDLAVIALGNGETYSVFAATSKILDLYLGEGKADPVAAMLPRVKANKEEDAKRVADRKAARVPKTKPSLPASAYAGTYTDKIYGDAVITEKDGALTLQFKPAPELFTGALTHWHFDTFQWQHADPFLEPGYITFSFDADHKVTGFKIDLHSPDFHFYKLDFKRPE
ncbi:MAG: serine hydrolase [Flavobacteriales bacterium]|nr:serine hydrolase [Flavobacteriales bacterium]